MAKQTDNIERLDAEIPECECPWCGSYIDSLQDSITPGPARKPQSGHVAICAECIQAMVFDDDMTPRKPVQGDISDKMLAVINRGKISVEAMKLRRDQSAEEN